MLKKTLQKTVNNTVWYVGLLFNFVSKKNGLKKNNLCIIRTDAIGDFVIFTSTLEYFRKKYENFEITLILQDRVKELAKSCSYIDSVIFFNEKKYRHNLFYKSLFLWKIYKQYFEICINPVYSRERIIDEIVLWSNAKEKIGWNTQSSNMTSKEKKRGDKIYTKLFNSKLSKYAHELERNKEFLHELEIEIKDFDTQNYYGHKEKKHIDKMFKQFNLDGKQIFVIIPGSLNQYRQWSCENWKNLMTGIIEITGNLKFLIIGSKKDKELIGIKPTDFLYKYTVNLCGQLVLNELGPLFENCFLVIGNETGPMHIAIASGVSTIAIMGGGHFGRFMPYGDMRKNRFVYKKMDCFQCNWKCIYSEKRCITEITVHEVIKEVKYVLNNKAYN